jgi:LPS export ABC transporter permease LptG/LPS export ABC transporter permease LptF
LPPAPKATCYLRLGLRLIDRYLLRAVIPPFLIALGVFTFLLAINPMLEYAQRLIAKGVALPTVGILLLTLLPSSLSLTIPISFLTGLLIGLGRLSGDRESVALQACGVGPIRILRPVLILALAVAAFDMYVLMRLKPDANQRFRDITFQLLSEKSAAEIKPRVFYEGFPQKVIYVQNATAAGAWTGVMVADTTDALRPALVLAESGQLILDTPNRLVALVLTNATRYAPGKPGTTVYTVSEEATTSVAVTAEAVFGSGGSQLRGFPEMDYAALQRSAAEKIQRGDSPHNEILHTQQMFSFPMACLVFAIIGLGLGLHTRKEGRLAGFAVAIAVVLAYYALMALSESWVKSLSESLKGHAWQTLPAYLGRWVPNIVLGIAGILLLWRRSRSVEGRVRIPLPRRVKGRNPTADTSPSPVARPAIVLRVPHHPIPGPRILDTYVTGYYLRIAALALVGLVSVFYIVTFVDLSDKIFKGQAGLSMLLALLWYQTPQFLTYILPIAVLIGVLGTIGGLTRSSELMVMRACGISLYRVATPMILLALAGSAVLFVLDDRVVGESTRKAETLNAGIRRLEPPRFNPTTPNWLVGEDGRIYHYQAYEGPTTLNGRRATLYGVSMYETANSPFRLTRHTYVARAYYASPAWQAVDGWTQAFGDSGSSGTANLRPGDRQEFHEKSVPMPPVEDFRRAQVDSARMNFGQLREYVRRLGASGVNVAEQEVQLHRKVAFPAVTLVLTLLAIPFGVTTGKKGALYGIGLAMVLAGAYFLLSTLFMAAGAAGVLPAPLAAWSVNLLFGIGALYLVFTVRT